MDSAAKKMSCTIEEYLRLEDRAKSRHEYRGGEIIAMAGTSLPHNLLTGRLYSRLSRHFESGSACQAFFTEVKIHNERTGSFCYPDVFAVCGELKLLEGRHDTLLNPVLIVEVLSPTTEAYDRGQKFADYQRIPSFREYVLVRQDAVQIEVFRRCDPQWSYSLIDDPEALVTLESVNLQFRLKDIYAGVSLQQAETGPRLLPDADVE